MHPSLPNLTVGSCSQNPKSNTFFNVGKDTKKQSKSPFPFPSDSDSPSVVGGKENNQEKAMRSFQASYSSVEVPSISGASPPMVVKEGRGMKSEDEIGNLDVVPQTITSGCEVGSTAADSDRFQDNDAMMKKKRGRSPGDQEHKRIERLLKNRVSAQEARERKKAYVTELEKRLKDSEKRNSELEEKLSTLQNDNQNLRHILKNTTVGRKGSGDVGNVGPQF